MFLNTSKHFLPNVSRSVLTSQVTLVRSQCLESIQSYPPKSLFFRIAKLFLCRPLLLHQIISSICPDVWLTGTILSEVWGKSRLY